MAEAVQRLREQVPLSEQVNVWCLFCFSGLDSTVHSVCYAEGLFWKYWMMSLQIQFLFLLALPQRPRYSGWEDSRVQWLGSEELSLPFQHPDPTRPKPQLSRPQSILSDPHPGARGHRRYGTIHCVTCKYKNKKNHRGKSDAIRVVMSCRRG